MTWTKDSPEYEIVIKLADMEQEGDIHGDDCSNKDNIIYFLTTEQNMTEEQANDFFQQMLTSGLRTAVWEDEYYVRGFKTYIETGTYPDKIIINYDPYNCTFEQPVTYHDLGAKWNSYGPQTLGHRAHLVKGTIPK